MSEGAITLRGMAQCTAPDRGHRTASGRANCPACGGRGRSYGYSSYSPRPSYSAGGGRSSYGSFGGSGGGGTRRRTRSGGTVSYTPTEWRAVQPYAEKAAEQAVAHPDKRDLFLCHAWDDREGSAKELHGHLKT